MLVIDFLDGDEEPVCNVSEDHTVLVWMGCRPSHPLVPDEFRDTTTCTADPQEYSGIVGEGLDSTGRYDRPFVFMGKNMNLAQSKFKGSGVPMLMGWHRMLDLRLTQRAGSPPAPGTPLLNDSIS